MTETNYRDLAERFPDGIRSSRELSRDHYAYLQKWLQMFRPYGYATRDDSWGELEKILDIVHRNLERRKQAKVSWIGRIRLAASALKDD